MDRRMKVLHQVQNLLITACLGLLFFGSADRVDACVEGLAWGMPFEQVTAHLGEGQAVSGQKTGRYVKRNVFLDRLPVSQATFEVDPEKGLTNLAYEFAIDDMTEVLAGLRAQHGPPLSTSLDHDSHNDQVWVWNTGEDLITAVKTAHADQQAFLISYRPSRLRPEIL